MKRIKILLFILLTIAITTGCGVSLLAENLEKGNKKFKVTILDVYDGIGYSAGNTTYVPPAGHRFIRVRLKIHNVSRKKRIVRLDKILLAYGKKIAHGPAIIDKDSIIAWRADHKLELDPKESNTRKLFFNFPIDVYPNILYIKEVGIIRIPLKKSK